MFTITFTGRGDRRPHTITTNDPFRRMDKIIRRGCTVLSVTQVGR